MQWGGVEKEWKVWREVVFKYAGKVCGMQKMGYRPIRKVSGGMRK